MCMHKPLYFNYLIDKKILNYYVKIIQIEKKYFDFHIFLRMVNFLLRFINFLLTTLSLKRITNSSMYNIHFR